MDYKELIKKAHQEAHEATCSKEVHDWIDWFEKKLCGNKEIIEDETDKDIVVTVRWFDGYLESFRAKQIRAGEALLWLRLEDGKNRNIPLRNVRWYSMYPESHES